MELWLLLILLGSITYLAIIRSVAVRTKKASKTRSSAPVLPTKQEEATARPISRNEETALRNCFPWGTYYLQHIDYRPQAILCRGKLRAVPEEAYKIIKQNVEKAFGDRFLLIFQESFKGQPFFALVPNAQQRSQDEALSKPGLALGLLLITAFTTTVVGTKLSGIDFDQLQTNPQLLLRGLPYSLGLIFILGVHELSHYLTTVRYKIRATLPYFIPEPFLFLGTFGAFIQMRSPVPNRKALFDVSIAGPIGGFIVTLPVLWWGLSLSETLPLVQESSILDFEAFDPRFSLLLALVAKFALGSALEPGMAIAFHPLAVAGYIGLIFTALNLMPVGQLDGGHIVHAMFGQRPAAIIGQVSRLLVFVLAIARPDFLLWAIILFFMPIIDQPALNDVTELDNRRDLFGLLALALLVVILLPLPGTIAQWLNI
ncbi:MAG: site-2 protease family protein [Cyanophyceae cyanobacterium]